MFTTPRHTTADFLKALCFHRDSVGTCGFLSSCSEYSRIYISFFVLQNPQIALFIVMGTEGDALRGYGSLTPDERRRLDSQPHAFTFRNTGAKYVTDPASALEPQEDIAVVE